MKKLILLIVVAFVFTISSLAGSNVEDISNNIAKKEKEIASLKTAPPFYLATITIEQRINKLYQQIQELKNKLESIPPKEIILKQIKIINARGYDALADLADVRLRMNGKDITATIPDNNNPVFDLEDIKINTENNVIEVMDEEGFTFDRMGTFKLKLDYRYDGQNKYKQSGAVGSKKKGFEWEATIEVIY